MVAVLQHQRWIAPPSKPEQLGHPFEADSAVAIAMDDNMRWGGRKSLGLQDLFI